MQRSKNTSNSNTCNTSPDTDGDTVVLLLLIHPWQHTNSLNTTDTDASSDSDKDSDTQTSILDHLMTPPTMWESKLWHCISCYSSHDALNLSLITGQPVIACSDASVNMANFSTFSWIIHCQQALWQGEGIVPGLVEDMYSGWLEAFGILTALQFLSNYLAQYPNTYQILPTVTIYCDDQGVLDCISKI